MMTSITELDPNFRDHLQTILRFCEELHTMANTYSSQKFAEEMGWISEPEIAENRTREEDLERGNAELKRMIRHFNEKHPENWLSWLHQNILALRQLEKDFENGKAIKGLNDKSLIPSLVDVLEAMLDDKEPKHTIYWALAVFPGLLKQYQDETSAPNK